MKSKNKKILLWVIIIFILLIAAFFLLKDTVLKSIYPLKYNEEIVKYSSEYQLDPYFVASVIWAESRYKPDAVSKRGAIGLMQVMPDTGEWIAEKLKIKDFDTSALNGTELNIRFGCWYLRYLEDKLGADKEKILAAYNAGPAKVQSWLKNKEYSSDGKSLEKIPFEETKKYVDKIERAYEVYKTLYKIQ